MYTSSIGMTLTLTSTTAMSLSFPAVNITTTLRMLERSPSVSNITFLRTLLSALSMSVVPPLKLYELISSWRESTVVCSSKWLMTLKFLAKAATATRVLPLSISNLLTRRDTNDFSMAKLSLPTLSDRSITKTTSKGHVDVSVTVAHCTSIGIQYRKKEEINIALFARRSHLSKQNL